MTALDDAPVVHADDRATWRRWLEEHHATERGAWLVTWRRRSGHQPRLDYEDAVEEALCFGWVDSTGGSYDADRGKLYFARRKPRSIWAASNKARVERLLAAGLMAPAGIAAVELARANGSWGQLDEIDRLEVPDDLASALEALPLAGEHFAAWPPSVRREALWRVASAKRDATRAARVREIAELAARNYRPGTGGEG